MSKQEILIVVSHTKDGGPEHQNLVREELEKMGAKWRMTKIDTNVAPSSSSARLAYLVTTILLEEVEG